MGVVLCYWGEPLGTFQFIRNQIKESHYIDVAETYISFIITKRIVVPYHAGPS